MRDRAFIGPNAINVCYAIVEGNLTCNKTLTPQWNVSTSWTRFDSFWDETAMQTCKQPLSTLLSY